MTISVSSSDPLSTVIARAIADVEAVEPVDLPFQLYTSIDTEAINLLERHQSSDWELRFTVEGHTVTVRGDRTVIVDEQVYSQRSRAADGI